MWWTMELPLWAACGLEGKGCEFILPDPICMWLVDNCGLFMHHATNHYRLKPGWGTSTENSLFESPKWAKWEDSALIASERSLHSSRALPCDAVVAGEEEELSYCLLSHTKSKGEVTCNPIEDFQTWLLLIRLKEQKGYGHLHSGRIPIHKLCDPVSFSSSLLSSSYPSPSSLGSLYLPLFSVQKGFGAVKRRKRREHKLTMGPA